jgi:DNA primase
MAFTPQFLDELRIRTGLADLVGKRVRLSRKGNEYSGLCPFHREKTPSFTLNEEKGFYHCFGCGAHGSAIDFVMSMEGLNFPEAVEFLANQAGLEVPIDSPKERERVKARQSLYDVIEIACVFFEQKLRMPEGYVALDYLRGRSLDDGTIGKFRLGFAPDGRGSLKAALRGENITDEQMIAACLLIQPEDKSRQAYDRFRNRIVFPIADKRGRIIAFGGRTIVGGDDNKLAKYLNSPETELFHKGQVLYNLSRASKLSREQGTVIVTEGYMDVIALSQVGIENAVAPLGTALTEEQISELWKVVREPIVCFDGDNAGVRAQGRAAERALALLKPGYALRFATLPAGEDPDSLIATKGSEALREVIARAEPLSEVLWRLETGGRMLKTPEQRASVQKTLEDHARRINDPTVRAHFLKDFKDRIWAASRRGANKHTPTMSIGAGAASSAKIDAHTLHERILIATLLGHPELFEQVGENLGTLSFSAPGLDNLRQEVLKTLAVEPDLDSEGIRRHLYNNGFSEMLHYVWGPKFFVNAFFAKPEIDIETALEGWGEIYALYKNTDLCTEIKEESQRLIDETSSENFDRLNTLSEQKLRASEGIEESYAKRAGGVARKN